MTIKYYDDIIQGTDEWLQLRRGILTASEMKFIITPTLKIANNDKTRSHLYELLAQRISGFVEPHFMSDDMLRGHEEEEMARYTYSAKFAPVRKVGFITNDKWGFTLGFSPDGLVGDPGQIECKSRRQKYQIETIIADEMPDDYRIQVQSGLLVSEREWCDFISYCGGLPMMVKRVYRDAAVQDAILTAATAFHAELDEKLAAYQSRLKEISDRLIPTERSVAATMFV